MIKTSLAEYYWLGLRVSYLRGAEKDFPIHGHGGILDNIDTFVSDLNDFGLSVTANVATAQGLMDFYHELREQETGAVLSHDQAVQLQALMETICITLDAEISDFEAFAVSPKRIGAAELVDDASALFAPGVFESLPDVARHDFAEACKCIAFERPTAAAFHIWRASQAVLQHVYCSLVRQKRVKTLTWQAILNDLRKRRQTRRHAALYAQLDTLRAAFGDPAQQPELVYDLNTVQDLWLACAEAVNRLARLLQR